MGLSNRIRTGVVARFRRAPLAALASALLAVLAVGGGGGGCAGNPKMLPVEQQVPIDRSVLTYPKDFAVRPFVRGLSAPVAIAWDEDRSLLVAEGGNYGDEPRIVGFKKDGSFFQIYPYGRRMFVDIGKPRFAMYGPIGGMAVYKGRIYVSHRDKDGFGVISALDHTGGHTTIQSQLPAQGDYSVTDIAIDRRNERIYFGVGAATNSGVVGLDNWSWVRTNPDVRDVPATQLRLMGFRFDSPNPFSGLFGPADIAVTAPFQPFNVSNQTEIRGGKYPGAAVLSCAINGGDLRVEGHGIRYPRGLGYNGYFCYFTNAGMELRGTRPIKNDPDALLRIASPGTWFGWPDFTTDLQSIEQDRYQPPRDMIARTGYPFKVLSVINRDASELKDPSGTIREPSLYGVFSPLSGVAKFDFVPQQSPFQNRRAIPQALVALSGDCAPFSTSGRPIIGPLGYKIVAVDLEGPRAIDPEKGMTNSHDFVRNTAGGPGSLIDPKNPNLLERPVDVKIGPDGWAYILDAGRMQIRDGHPSYEPGTGKIFLVAPQAEPVMYHDPESSTKPVHK